jgi:hypothetical protein
MSTTESRRARVVVAMVVGARMRANDLEFKILYIGFQASHFATLGLVIKSQKKK